jgi:hypothetical protein
VRCRVRRGSQAFTRTAPILLNGRLSLATCWQHHTQAPCAQGRARHAWQWGATGAAALSASLTCFGRRPTGGLSHCRVQLWDVDSTAMCVSKLDLLQQVLLEGWLGPARRLLPAGCRTRIVAGRSNVAVGAGCHCMVHGVQDCLCLQLPQMHSMLADTCHTVHAPAAATAAAAHININTHSSGWEQVTSG